MHARSAESLFAASFMLWTATSASAQADAAQGTAPGAAGASQDIVVTALKRSQSIQNVAAAVSAVDATTIKQLGITDATNLQFYVPSLVSGKVAGITAISIRGIGLNQFGYTSQPGVAVHIDGVYQSRLATGGLGQIDLDRIEVLRGPQGTLYGRNATGGAVNFITASPNDRFEGSALAGFASYDEYHLQGILNVPLSDRVRTRLVVDYTDRGKGFVKNTVPGGLDADKGATLSARFKLAADLTDTLTAEFSSFYVRRTGAFPWLQLTADPSAAAIAANPFLAGAVVPKQPLRFSANTPSTSRLETYGGSATFTVDLGAAKLKSITAYSRFDYRDQYDSDGTNVDFITLRDRTKSTTISQELNLSGKSGSVDWLIGAFYMNDDLSTGSPFSFPLGYPGSFLPPGASFNSYSAPYKTKTGAIFTDDTINLTSKLRLIVGARYSVDKIRAVSSTEIDVGPFQSFLCKAVITEPKFHSFTPRAGFQYDVAAGVESYATVSRGFKDGGVNGCNTVYKPEKITAYEGGLRARLFDGNVTLNPTVFYYDYTNFQVAQFLGLAMPVINAPKATEKGFELEASWRATGQLSFNGNLTLLDAKYGGGFFNADSLDPAAALDPIGAAQNLKGKRLNRAPTASGSIGAQYRTAQTDLGRLTMRGDVYLSSRVYFREFNSRSDSQSSYSIVNLNVTWDDPSERYSARLYVTNLGNTHYLGQLGASNAYGSRFATYGSPRQFGAELRARF